MTRQKPTHCYVSRKPCGCITALAAYHYDWRRDVAQIVEQEIKAGMLVNCITWAEYMQGGVALLPQDCPHGEPVGAGMTQGSFLAVVE
jgi:hypothetical protein